MTNNKEVLSWVIRIIGVLLLITYGGFYYPSIIKPEGILERIGFLAQFVAILLILSRVALFSFEERKNIK